MRVLVTGGAGFIGSHIAEACLAAGHEVAVIDDLSSGKRENLPGEVPLHVVDVADSEAVDEVFRAVRPEHVIHQAAQISVSRSVREPAFDARVNVLGLLHVLEASARHGARSVVFASSGGVLYGDVWEPADEKHPAAPISPYGISKLTGEHYLQFFGREHGLKCAAIRYGNVYGPRQDPHGEAGVVAIFLQRLLRGEACVINGDGKYVRDYVFVEDVARANVLAMEAAEARADVAGADAAGEGNGGATGSVAAVAQPVERGAGGTDIPAIDGADGTAGFRAYNVGTGIGTDVNELAAKLRESLHKVMSQRTDRDAELPLPTYGPPRPGDLRSSLLDAGKIERELGWRPMVGVEEGLRRTAEWFASIHNGYMERNGR